MAKTNGNPKWNQFFDMKIETAFQKEIRFPESITATTL